VVNTDKEGNGSVRTRKPLSPLKRKRGGGTPNKISNRAVNRRGTVKKKKKLSKLLRGGTESSQKTPFACLEVGEQTEKRNAVEEGTNKSDKGGVAAEEGYWGQQREGSKPKTVGSLWKEE